MTTHCKCQVISSRDIVGSPRRPPNHNCPSSHHTRIGLIDCVISYIHTHWPKYGAIWIWWRIIREHDKSPLLTHKSIQTNALCVSVSDLSPQKTNKQTNKRYENHNKQRINGAISLSSLWSSNNIHYSRPVLIDGFDWLIDDDAFCVSSYHITSHHITSLHQHQQPHKRNAITTTPPKP